MNIIKKIMLIVMICQFITIFILSACLTYSQHTIKLCRIEANQTSQTISNLKNEVIRQTDILNTRTAQLEALKTCKTLADYTNIWEKINAENSATYK